MTYDMMVYLVGEMCTLDQGSVHNERSDARQHLLCFVELGHFCCFLFVVTTGQKKTSTGWENRTPDLNGVNVTF